MYNKVYRDQEVTAIEPHAVVPCVTLLKLTYLDGVEKTIEFNFTIYNESKPSLDYLETRIRDECHHGFLWDIKTKTLHNIHTVSSIQTLSASTKFQKELTDLSNET